MEGTTLDAQYRSLSTLHLEPRPNAQRSRPRTESTPWLQGTPWTQPRLPGLAAPPDRAGHENAPSPWAWAGALRLSYHRQHCAQQSHAPNTSAGWRGYAGAPSGGLRLRSPYRCQNAKHVTAVDAIDGHVADDREGVTFERLQPTGGVLAISPARQIRLMHAQGRLAKRRGVSSTLFRERITSFSYCSAVCVGVQACLGERNGRVAAQSDIASAAIDRNSLYPSL